MTPPYELDNIDMDIYLQSPIWQEKFSDYLNHMTAALEQIAAHVPQAQNFYRFPLIEISIVLGDDDNIQQLNRDYRGRNAPTNVLSFPSLSEEKIDIILRQAEQIPEFPVALGDIVFAFETIEGEAIAQGKRFCDHFCHLYIHSMLHLLGYDHIEEGDAQVMEAFEKELLSKLSIDDPYQD